MEKQLTLRSMPLQPTTYNAEARSVRAVVATDTEVQVYDWERGEVIVEYLLADGFQLPEGRAQVPLLDSHFRWGVGGVLGSVRDFSVMGGQVLGDVYFSSAEDSRDPETKVREGHLTDLSGGYSVEESVWVQRGEKKLIGAREFVGPCKISTRWTLREVSVTAIGADALTTFRSEQIPPQMQEYMKKQIEHALSERNNSVTTTPPKGDPIMDPITPTPPPAIDENKVRQEAQIAERTRVTEIQALAARHGASVQNMSELATQAINEGWDSSKLGQEILARMAAPKTVDTNAASQAPDVQVRAEWGKPWQKRAAVQLRYMEAKLYGRSNAQLLGEQLAEMQRNLGERQIQAELVDAIQIIESAKLPPLQAVRLMSTLSAGAGSNTLPAPFLAEVFVIVEERGLARRMFRPIPMTSKTLDMSTVATKAIAYWKTEGSNGTPADLAFGTGQLAAGELMAITSWSSEVEEDTAIAWLSIVQESMAEAILDKEDLAGFKGDGTSDYGGFTGIANASTNIVSLSVGKTSFTQATADDFRLIRDALSIAKRRGAVWMLHPTMVSQVEGLKNTQGDYVYRAPSGERPAYLWGYPVANNGEGIETMPSTGDSGAAKVYAAFGNPQHMLMGMRRELDLMMSREGILNSAANAITFNALQANGTILRMTERIAFTLPLTTAIAVGKTAAA
jgi:HK97 family phage major capsid protein